MPAVECCVQLIHSILCTVLWTKYLVTQAVPARLMEAACERRIPMPNWCSNRMHFSGEPAQIAEIKRLASGAVTPFYRRAINEGIQLFLAGSAGLLQTTEDVRFEPCPGLTAAGRGVVSPENIAFTRWLTHLQNGVLLDEQNCLMLHELWLQSGTGQRRWEGLPDDVRDTITVLFTAKRGDWCGFWSNEDVSVWWNRLCDNVLPEKPCRLTC